MKSRVVSTIALALAILASGVALADGHHGGGGHYGGGDHHHHGGYGGSVGIYLGGPGWGGPWGYGYPYYGYGYGYGYGAPYGYGYGYPYGRAYRAYPDHSVNDSTEYVERDSAPADSAAPGMQNIWFYCTSPQGYYPYVKQCDREWQEVVPQDSHNNAPPRLAH